MTATDDLTLEDFDSAFLDGPEAHEPDPEQTDEQAQEPNAEFVEEVKESPRAKRYRLKVRKALNFGIKLMAGNPHTVDDAAALLYHGPGISAAIGQLADHDDKVRKVIDFLSDDAIDNPYILAGMAVATFGFQVVRNHEAGLAKGKQVARIKIPFTKRYIPLKFSIRLHFPGIRNVSYEPHYLTSVVFGNPDVQAKLAAQGIKVAWNPNMNGYHR